MSAEFFALSPVDAWFFRDGRPFNAGDPAQVPTPSLFPPLATTCIGALRAAIARANGWNGSGNWSPRVQALVGAEQELGPLNFRGPYVLRGNEPLLPAPNVLARTKNAATGGHFIRLSPGVPRRCDLEGKAGVRLPVAPHGVRGMKPLDGALLTEEGYEAVLAGGVPSENQVIPLTTLAPRETRVGLQIRPETRAADPGYLYSLRFVRPNKGVSVAMIAEGRSGHPVASSFVPLGGEGRAAWLTTVPEFSAIPKPPTLEPAGGMLRYIVFLVTPADLGQTWPGPADSLGALPGKVVSACIGRPVAAGGWRDGKGPLPLRPLVPAGGAWFIEASARDEVRVMAAHGSQIGQRPEWGFGQIAIGAWPEHGQGIKDREHVA